MSNKFYKKKDGLTKDKIIQSLKEMARKNSTINDKEATMTFITPTKMEITPLTMTLEEFHLETIKRLGKRHLDKRILCYLKDNKVYLEVL